MRRQAGFTLVELLIGLVILSILVAVAAPSFSTAMAQQRLRQASSELRSTVAFARSEAVKRNAQVRLLPRTGGWSNGWCVEESATASACTTSPLSERVLGSSISVSGQTVGGTAITSVNLNSWGRPTSGCPKFQFSTSATSSTCTVCLTVLSDGRVLTESGACDGSCTGTDSQTAWRGTCS